jgi:hypothetical protein
MWRYYNSLIAIAACGVLMSNFTSAEDINMAEVRKLAKLSVDEIFDGVPVPLIKLDKYWEIIRERKRPKVVFFYSNNDGPSQRVATLIRFVAMDYSDRLAFRRVKVVEKGKPDAKLRRDLEARFSLDKTPGILFYDNVGDKMVLEDEDYVDADFKEFRTPKMLLWKTYYSAVRKELDQLLAD